MAVIDRAAKGAPDAMAPPFDFRPHLDPGEELLWSGKPDPVSNPNDLTDVMFLMLLLVVMFSGFIGWAVADRHPLALLMLGAALLVMTWVYFRIGPWDRALRAGVTYGVTNRRVLRADEKSMLIRGRDLIDIEDVEVSRGTGVGTVRFRIGGDKMWLREEASEVFSITSPLPAFHDIADAAEVAALVNRLRGAIAAEPAWRDRQPRRLPRWVPREMRF